VSHELKSLEERKVEALEEIAAELGSISQSLRTLTMDDADRHIGLAEVLEELSEIRRSLPGGAMT